MQDNKGDVCIVVSGLGRGGAETHLSHILPGLLQRGLNITVLPIRSGGELLPKFRAAGLQVLEPTFSRPASGKIRLIFWYSYRFLSIFFFLLFKRPRIVHFFLPEGYLIGGIASVLAHIPIKIMSRRSMNYYQQKYPPFIRKIEYFLHTKMDAVLGNSRSVTEQLISEENVTADKVHLIYNGLPIVDDCAKSEKQKIRQRLLETYQIPLDTTLIVKVANLIPYKGHSDLLKACGMFKTKKWHLLLVGEDRNNYLDILKEEAQQLGIENQVTFTGGQSDILPYLNAADIGTLTSHEEGFSNAILEAMRAKLPMVVTDVGGNAEAVQESETGFICPPRNPEKLSDAFSKLLNDVKIREEMGQKAQDVFISNFSLESCLDQYEALYTSFSKTVK